MTNQDDKLPPQDIDAEISVLGSLMLDKDIINKVADTLEPEDFYHPAHQKIYDAVLDLFEKGEPVDMLTVSTRLKEKGLEEDVGGVDYLSELMDQVPTSAHAEHYAEIVKEKKSRRELMQASSSINEKALEEGDFESLLDEAEKKILQISQKSRTEKFMHIKEELPKAYERLEKLHEGKKEGRLRGVPTGFDKLDSKLSGLQSSDFIILGARPSVGKTSLALDIARNASLKGHNVGVFSMEMSGEQIVDRVISSQSQVPLWRLRTGKIHDETEFSMIRSALDELSQISLFVEDTPSPNILHVRSMARKLQVQHGLDLLIIDYLQLIQPRSSVNSTVQKVTEISRGVKSLARELDVPVLAVSQLSRAVDQRETSRPRLSDLRQSGSLEQDADVVMFLYRKDRDKVDVSEEEENIMEVIIAKHRNGPLGTVKLYFDQEKVTFRSIDKEHEEEGQEIESITG
ncbi:MAG: replicative DNA helicase [Candidatus Magasanikbacteria bacterium]